MTIAWESIEDLVRQRDEARLESLRLESLRLRDRLASAEFRANSLQSTLGVVESDLEDTRENREFADDVIERAAHTLGCDVTSTPEHSHHACVLNRAAAMVSALEGAREALLEGQDHSGCAVAASRCLTCAAVDVALESVPAAHGRVCLCSRCEEQRFSAWAGRARKLPREAGLPEGNRLDLIHELHASVAIRHPLGIAERLYEAITGLHVGDDAAGADLGIGCAVGVLEELAEDERKSRELREARNSNDVDECEAGGEA